MDLRQAKADAQNRLERAEAEAKAAKALIKAIEGYERVAGPSATAIEAEKQAQGAPAE